ncbi:MAG: pyrimidine 5'-nucleotidase [Alphaproteobacteria bacterium]|nr:pyrimidine 5'-nucleotidase [Alphaproteobacteria bacterium]
MQRPSLEHLDSWVFDLDNTLYPATSSLFPQIDQRMRAFIAELLGLSDAEAHALQKRYYREFGTTLRGLMLVHGLEPQRFLDYVHDIDRSVLTPSLELGKALAGLPGRKLIFTNGTESHAVKVLERLGLSCHFEGIFDIHASDYVPKPDPLTYKRLLARFDLKAERAAMFEDIARNLKPAFELGMTTVWVKAEEPEFYHDTEDAHVHYATDDLAQWLAYASATGKAT